MEFGIERGWDVDLPIAIARFMFQPKKTGKH